MSAGTGKIKVVSAARAGVPRASNIGDPNYDAAALGVKAAAPITYAKPPSSLGTSKVTAAPAKRVGLGTQPVTKPKAKPIMSTQRITPKAAPKPVARAARTPVARAKPAPKPVVKAAPKPVVKAAPKPVVRGTARTPAPARRAPAPKPAFKAPAMPAMPAMPTPAKVAPPARTAGGIDLLERVETLKLLTALYNAGALTKIERAGLLSSLEQAGALP